MRDAEVEYEWRVLWDTGARRSVRQGSTEQAARNFAKIFENKNSVVERREVVRGPWEEVSNNE